MGIGHTEDAAVAVMKAEVPVANLLAKAEHLQADLISGRAELRELYRFNCVAEEHVKTAERFLLNIDLPSYGQPEFHDYSSHPSAAAWRGAIERLRADPSAPPPV